MKRASKVTLAIPLVILACGILIPVMMQGGSETEPAEGEAVRRHAGRSADEWEELARSALKSGQLDRALSYAKSAEVVEPGAQYSELIVGVRRARHRARLVEENGERFLGEPSSNVAFAAAGGETVRVRSVTARPGESLWSLAASIVAAERGLTPSEVEDEAGVYAVWDRLTDANGVRGLDVGESVLIPESDQAVSAIALARARADSEAEYAAAGP